MMQTMSVLVPILLLLFLGIAGTYYQNFAIWKFTIYSVPLLIFSLFLLNSRDRLKFLLQMIVLFLPFVGLVVPPGRLGITVFDVLMILAVLILIIGKFSGKQEIDLFPYSFVWFAVLLIIPSIITSISFINSLESFVQILGFYLVTVLFVHYSKDEGFLKSIHVNLSIALILICLFIFLEKATGINLNYGGRNINYLSYVGSIKIYRAAGIFQDPQKAAQFIAVIMTYLAVINSRKTFKGQYYKILSTIAILMAVPALVITESRAAILSAAVVLPAFLLLFNKAGIFKRLIIGLVLLSVVVFICSSGDNYGVFGKFLPKSLTVRLTHASSSYETRQKIWAESWRVFEYNPITGIGPGNYQEFLLQENPYLRKVLDNGGYIPTMPENGYLKILYELGIIGTIGSLYFLLVLIIRMIKQIFINGNEEAVSQNIAICAGLLVFSTTFLTIYTISDARNAVLLAFFVSIVLANREKNTAMECSESEFGCL